MSLLALVIAIVVIAAIIYGVYWVLGQTPIANPTVRTFVYVIVGIIIILFLLGLLFHGLPNVTSLGV